MFQKFSKQGFLNTINKTKSFMGSAYHHTKSFLGNVDHGVRIAKKAYARMDSVISHYAGNKVNHNVMKVVNSNEQIRHKLVSGHNQIEEHVNSVATKFHKAGLNIGI